MAREKLILLVPEDYDGPVDGAFEEVRTDPTVTRPKAFTELVPEDGSTSVDRAFISDASKQTLADQHRAYEDAKALGDTQGQIDALETIVTDLWHIVSGEAVSETKTNYPAK